eukprot:CAMPEP_0178991820 /NCGR_PEP_ID=MMETSP0795-20121207/5752_1 /TAXON_ID=88552 /ORGANISM="Amoebophrya sp., Strain Ameob2" /LENGTH=264 /DNA_ID=CAMNT_0020683595 /DNA_START=182 /DNA_END=976 /DNA_ORIENTATION=-
MGGACGSKHAATGVTSPEPAAPGGATADGDGSKLPTITVTPPQPTPPNSTAAVVKQEALAQQEKAAREEQEQALSEDLVAALQKFHSALRWGKPVEDLEALFLPELLNAADPKNGNRGIHIAAQNGHLAITKWLVAEKNCNVNAQNKKGQTALHMSVEYDCYHQNVFLLAHGADVEKENADGHPALLGIDGKKTGMDAWDSPVNLLKSVSNEEEMRAAFEALEQAAADGEVIDKAMLAQTGMKKKKEHKDWWDAKGFMGIISKF